jgi:hypothetical protein
VSWHLACAFSDSRPRGHGRNAQHDRRLWLSDSEDVGESRSGSS